MSRPAVVEEHEEDLGPLRLDLKIEKWRTLMPFRTAVHTVECAEVLVASLESGGLRGLGEAVGVHYLGENAAVIRDQILRNQEAIEAGITRGKLQRLLPPGGARNALDCALWDLEAKVKGSPVWKLAHVGKPRPLITTFTCGADTPERMANAAVRFVHARAIKIKLTGDRDDGDRIRAVREARPDVWLGVDANQSLTIQSLNQLFGVMTNANVSLLEQPFPIGQDMRLDGVTSPIPIAADESAQSLTDIPKLAGRYQVCNIKLDKCGGLTEGLAMVASALSFGMQPMVGCMMTTSRSIAPAFLLGQLCEVVDLDAPVFLKTDHPAKAEYVDGSVTCPDALWGGPT